MKTSNEILKEYNEKEMCTDIVEMDGKTYYSELDTLCLMEEYEEQFKPVCEGCHIKEELDEALKHIKELYEQIKDMKREIRDLENTSDIGRFGYGD